VELLPISTPHCRIERDGHVLIVTMNRPEVRNALSADMLVGMASAWAYASAEPGIRVAILTGAQGTFCSGADLKAMGQPSSDPEVRARAAGITDYHWKGLLREDLPTKPVICAVEGYAVAGGTELLVGTDLRIVAESATLGLFEAKRALFPMSPWAAAPYGCRARSRTATPWTSCSPGGRSPRPRRCRWAWSTGWSRTARR
jgi:enoyl-CoA hydratase